MISYDSLSLGTSLKPGNSMFRSSVLKDRVINRESNNLRLLNADRTETRGGSIARFLNIQSGKQKRLKEI
jgi:hypothetical protein